METKLGRQLFGRAVAVLNDWRNYPSDIIAAADAAHRAGDEEVRAHG